MAAETAEKLAQQSRATSSVRQVVDALWAVALAQKPLADAIAAEGSIYLDWLDSTLGHVAGAPVAVANEGLLTVVVGPERPFSGGLAARVWRQVPRREHLIVVGERLKEAAERARSSAVHQRLSFAPGPSSTAELESAASKANDLILREAKGRDVELLYPRGDGTLHRALLLAARREPNLSRHEVLSPRARVVARLLEESLAGRLSVALAETLRVELSVRVAILDSARNATDQRMNELSLAWQLARQEEITNELNELVAARLSATSG